MHLTPPSLSLFPSRHSFLLVTCRPAPTPLFSRHHVVGSGTLYRPKDPQHEDRGRKLIFKHSFLFFPFSAPRSTSQNGLVGLKKNEPACENYSSCASAAATRLDTNRRQRVWQPRPRYHNDHVPAIVSLASADLSSKTASWTFPP